MNVVRPDYTQYYDPTYTYWQGYNAWQNYYDASGAAATDPTGAYYQHSMVQSNWNPQTKWLPLEQKRFSISNLHILFLEIQ